MNDYRGIADLYDLYVTDTGDHAFWSWCAAQTQGPILELMAGTGRATVALRAAHPRTVVALDLAPPMLSRLLERFRGEPRPVRAVCGDVTMLPFRGMRYGLVALPFNSFGEVIEAAGRAAVLRELRRVLLPGGMAVVTLHDPGRRRQTLDAALHRAGPFGNGDRRLEVLVRGRLLTGEVAESEQTYRVLDASDRVLEERQLTLRFALPDAVSLATMAQAASLEVRALYGDYDRTPYAAGHSPYILAILGPAPEAGPA